MLPLDERFVGDWVVQDEDFNTCFSFRIVDGRYEVSAIDLDDEELFEIRDVEWRGDSLACTAVMPSTNWVTRNVFHLLPDGTLMEELTYREIWKRKGGAPAEQSLEGTWIAQGEDSDVEITIAGAKGQYTVSGTVLSTGEALRIDEVQWDGSALSFIASVPLSGFRIKNRFRLLEDGTAAVDVTEYEIWEKVEAG